MPTQNKYELRSQEVQEVLSTPPRFLTFWGNALVIVVLATGLFFLGRYKIAQTIKTPVKIIATNGRVALLIDSAYSDQIKVNQKVKLQLNTGKIMMEGSIAKKMDTTINMTPTLLLVLTEPASGNFPGTSPSDGAVNGQAEIQIDKQSLLHLFVSK